MNPSRFLAHKHNQNLRRQMHWRRPERDLLAGIHPTYCVPGAPHRRLISRGRCPVREGRLLLFFAQARNVLCRSLVAASPPVANRSSTRKGRYPNPTNLGHRTNRCVSVIKQWPEGSPRREEKNPARPSQEISLRRPESVAQTKRLGPPENPERPAQGPSRKMQKKRKEKIFGAGPGIRGMARSGRTGPFSLTCHASREDETATERRPLRPFPPPTGRVVSDRSRRPSPSS